MTKMLAQLTHLSELGLDQTRPLTNPNQKREQSISDLPDCKTTRWQISHHSNMEVALSWSWKSLMLHQHLLQVNIWLCIFKTAPFNLRLDHTESESLSFPWVRELFVQVLPCIMLWYFHCPDSPFTSCCQTPNSFVLVSPSYKPMMPNIINFNDFIWFFFNF